MSAAETRELPAAARSARGTPAGALADPAGRLTVAAAALGLGGLALAVDEPARMTAPLALAGAGTVLAAFALGPRAAQVLRRGRALVAGAGVAAIAIALALSALVADGPEYALGRLAVALPVGLLPAALVAVAALGGVVLLADALGARLGLAARGRTPWQRLSGAGPATAPAPWRGAAGLALVALAAVLGVGLVASATGGGLVGLALAGAVVSGALLAAVMPLIVAALARSDRGRLEAAREDERQRVAAHLHDSVLQTLALVQRQAHDPAAVARLARRQEHALRAWMSGEAELGADTLAAALRDAVAGTEDEHGIAVEATILGDRPLDRAGEALVAAAREALRNAARHAPGAPVFVFAQADAGGAEVFVRDEGGGFEPAAVPTERRGVRDAIVGRMAAAGGRATVESAPGEGTEVVLRIGDVRERP